MNKRMKKKKLKNKCEGATNMSAQTATPVLCEKDSHENTINLLSYIRKFNENNTSKKENDIKRIYELENRNSGSDEFPLLWNEED